MAIKMRVNNNKESKCSICNIEYKNTAEMYDLKFNKNTFTLCRKCNEVLFQKTLRASVLYNGKIKSKEDMKRIRNEYDHTYGHFIGTMSISEALRGIKTEEIKK